MLISSSELVTEFTLDHIDMIPSNILMFILDLLILWNFLIKSGSSMFSLMNNGLTLNPVVHRVLFILMRFIVKFLAN